MRFLQRTCRKKEKCVRGSQKAGWAGCLLMESNKGQRLFLPVCDSQTMGQLPSTPQTHWQASHLGPHLTTDKTNSYSTPLPRLHSLARLPIGVERPMARLSRNHEVSFFSLLHLTMMNVAGANCTTPLCRLLPTWSSLDCVILDIFPAFKPPPPPPPCSARGLIWCRCTFSLSEAVQTGFFIYLFSFWLEHFLSLFLFILCSSDFRFICTGFSFFSPPFLGIHSCGMHQPEQRGKQRTLLAAQHPAKEIAGFDFSWSNKPLTCVTPPPSEEVKVMQLCKKSNVTKNHVRQWWHMPRRAEWETSFLLALHI